MHCVLRSAVFQGLELYRLVEKVPLGNSRSAFEQEERRWVTDAIHSTLAARGFRVAEDAADFLLTFELPPGSSGMIRLSVQLPEGDEPVWAATAHDRGYPARSVEAREARMRSAVERLLEQFPPPPESAG